MKTNYKCQPWHQKQALILAAQMPENLDDAIIIADFLRNLLDILRDDENLKLNRTVLPFPQLVGGCAVSSNLVYPAG